MADGDGDGIGPGEEVIRRIREGLQLEDGWTVQTKQSLKWWGGLLAQQIWVEPTEAGLRVHVSTDVLAGVADSPAVTAKLSGLNRFAILSALAWDPATGELALRAGATWTEGSLRHVEPLLLAAVSLQAAQAHAQVDEWAELLGGQPAVSVHPESGLRKEPAERLDIMGSVFSRLGDETSPFGESDMDAALRMAPAPWNSAKRSGIGFEAELPTSAGMAVLTVSAETRHPLLGSGCHFSARVPLEDGSDAARLAVRLNLAESRALGDWHTLGAWCEAGEDEVSCVTFLPAALYEPGLIALLCGNAGQRARWAAAWLADPPPEETPRPVAAEATESGTT